MLFWIGIAGLAMLLICILILLKIFATVKDALDRQPETVKHLFIGWHDDNSNIDVKATLNAWKERYDQDYHNTGETLGHLCDDVRFLKKEMHKMQEKINEMYVEEE